MLPIQFFAGKYLTVWQNGAEKQSFELADGAKVCYEESNVLFCSGNTILTFQRSDKLKFAFTDTPTAISKETADVRTNRFKINGNILNVCLNVANATSVSIVNAAGMEVKNGKTDNNGEWTVDLSSLCPGMYIFKSKTSSFKFIIK